MVKACGNSAVQGDEVGEVGEESGGFEALDLAILDRLLVQV